MRAKFLAFLVALLSTGGTAGCGAADTGTHSDGGFVAASFAAQAGGEGAGVEPQQALHTIVDRGAIGGPVLDVRVPPGWKIQSDVRWDNVDGQCSWAIGSPMFRMTSPDGKQAIELLPGFLVTTFEQEIRRRGSSPGDFCIVGMAESGEALAERIAVPFLRPGADIRGMRQVALAPEVAEVAQRLQAMPANGMQVIPYGTEASLAHVDGTVEKITLGGVVLASPQMMPGVPPLVLNQNMTGWAVRAPADRLAATERIAAQVRASMRLRSDWKQKLGAYQNRLTRPVFARPGGGGGNRGGGGDGTGGGFDMDGWRAGQAADDEAQRRRIETIREEERCTLADGSVVTVSIHSGCPR